MKPIKLNDLLQLADLSNVKIRFNLMFEENWNPIELFQNGQSELMLKGQYWNYAKRKSFKKDQITIGLVRIKPKEDNWLLFHIGLVTEDLEIQNGIGYHYESLSHYEKFVGRVIVRFKNRVQTMIRNAESVLDECYVAEILPDVYDNDLFPGYERVCINWSDLKRVLDKRAWKTALENQKGVYLLTDTSNGKHYVGSASGEKMIWGRWKSYAKNGHGGNVALKKLAVEHIQRHFIYSILDIYKASTSDQIILDRESWWKETLKSREFGYNLN
jgi:hypothetical protein